MTHRIVQTQEMFVIGLKATMSFETIAEETGKLARQFMPRLQEVKNRVDIFTISLQNHDNFDYQNLPPARTFEKWLGVEVANLNEVPEGMEILAIKSGNYLVIDFKGSMQEFVKNWHYIHSQWLPNSEFKLDNRPHFEKLSSKYSPMNVVNEEEIWIPVI